MVINRRWTPPHSPTSITVRYPEALVCSGLNLLIAMSSTLALRVTWVVLTLTAIPATWLVLIPFSVVAGHFWGQTVYGLTVTVMESVFAIGARSFSCLLPLAEA